jgi:hypothetical protein
MPLGDPERGRPTLPDEEEELPGQVRLPAVRSEAVDDQYVDHYEPHVFRSLWMQEAPATKKCELETAAMPRMKPRTM